MTLVQLEYVVALDTYRHFATAANKCFVTQPTLSMQLQKLEEELKVKIFDRSKQPVLPTETGTAVIEQAKKIIAERDTLHEILQSKNGIVNGELKLAIIPTLAPYLLPLFIKTFTKKYPFVKLQVTEMTTERIVNGLRDGKVDAGILVTPLNENGIKEHILFYEEMLVYVSKNNPAYKKNYLLPSELDPGKLWLLEEGHCFRSQIMNLCELREAGIEHTHFEYEASSLETLKRMVDLYDGITILPELATFGLPAAQQKHLRYFKKPTPVREVSMAVHRTFVKKRLVDYLKNEIINAIPHKMTAIKKQNIISVD